MSDIQLVFQWWSALFLVGVAAFPLTKILFSSWPATPNPPAGGEGWYDKGYFFSKAVGMAVVTYIVFLMGTLRIMPFTQTTIWISIATLFFLGLFLSILKFQTFFENCNLKIKNLRKRGWGSITLLLLEELFFFVALLFWSWVKAHEPSIQALEKFMDYGFMQSLLNSSYFPAPDMWWAGGTINYYYFGHLVTSVLTRLSGLDLSVTFNLMLASLFALTLTMSFSIGFQLFRIGPIQRIGRIGHMQTLLAGALTAFLVTLAGNMQTIYAFTKGYMGDAVVPFWTILWSPGEFLARVGEGMNTYWYANATRFIPFTIHEFPSYSFVVSDVHGHVLSIPFVLLALALLIMLFARNLHDRNNFQFSNHNFQSIFQISNFKFQIAFFGFLLGILLMTNALDGPIYGLLFVFLLLTTSKFEIRNLKFEINSKFEIFHGQWGKIGLIVIVAVIAGLTALPFLLHFKSFASGIGVNCPPEFLANTKIVPFIFEGVEKCQKSPFWMMELLWGFFWYTGIWLFVKRVWGTGEYDSLVNRILKVFFVFGIVLIIVPEFLYVKDIYPAHFRSNTMFKLGYQAFIMWSIVAGYVIVHFIFQRTGPIFNYQFSIFKQIFKSKIFNYKTLRIVFFILLIPQLFLISIFPIFSIRSYFGELKTYKGIDGLDWLRNEYPDDWKAIEWMKQATRNMVSPLVIVEADGDSYTNYNHVSAFAGVPSIVGWAVHEWLWRGGYDEVGPRREDVRIIYESGDPESIRQILERYHVRYILVGKLEREKFTNLQEESLSSLGTVVFQSGDTVIYEVR